MSNHQLSGLPEWVNAIARQLEPKQRRKVNRRLAQKMRSENRKRTQDQTDADGNDFIRPLKSENDPMFREITALRFFRTKGTDSEAQFGFTGSASRIAKVHQFGELSEVRPHSKKYPYPERTLVGINKDDEQIVLEILQDYLTKDYD